MENKPDRLNINRIIRIEGMVAVVFASALGVSLAHYLGAKLDPLTVVISVLVCLAIFELRNFLDAYFEHPESYQSTLNLSDPWRKELNKVKRPLLLQTTLLILTAGAVMTLILAVLHRLDGNSFLLIGISLVAMFFTASPPIRLGKAGYEEIIESLFIANFVPAIVFTIQGQPPSFLLLEKTLPLTFIYLAMKIVFSLQAFGTDILYGRQSLVTRLGWQRAVVLHNLLLLVAFLWIGLFAILGISWNMTWPLLLGLPFAGLEIWQVVRISEGGKPAWKLLRWVSYGLFLLMVYMELIPLWL